MNAIFLILLGFFVFIGFIVVVVSLIVFLVRWLAGALRGAAGYPTPSHYVPLTRAACPRCEAVGLGEGATRCPVCGWSARPETSPPSPRPVLALNHLGRIVERWGDLGLIPPTARDRLVAAILAEVNRLDATPAAARPVVDPIPGPESGPVRPPIVPPSPTPKAQSRVSPIEAASPARPVPNRWAGLVAAFLEERSIRWGEVVGGLLVVGCSLALVVSLWGRIAERPALRAVLGWLATALLIELGRFAGRRWRLPTTDQALTTVGVLLVPLNALALGAAGLATGWIAPSLALAAALGLTVRAASGVLGGPLWPLIVGVVGPTLALLAVGRAGVPDAAGPVAAWLATVGAIGGWLMARGRRGDAPAGWGADLLRLLGASGFAAVLATGRAVVAGAGAAGTIPSWLAGVVPLAGLALLVPGFALIRRRDETNPTGERTTGLALAAGGVGALLVGLILAWPEPARLLPVAVGDGLILGVLAVVGRVRAARVAGALCLTLAFLLARGVEVGRLGWWASADEVLRLLLSGESGRWLALVTLLAVTLASFRRGTGPRARADDWAIVAMLVGCASLGLATLDGLGRVGDPAGATSTFALQAVLAPALGLVGRRDRSGRRGTVLNSVGSAAFLAFLVQALVFGGLAVDLPSPAIAAMILHAAGSGGIAWAVDRWLRDRPERDRVDSLVRVLGRSALLTASLAAVALGLGAIQAAVPASVQGGYGLALAASALILAGRFRSVAGVVLASGAAGWALVFGHAARLGWGIVPLDWGVLIEWAQATALVDATAVLAWAAVRADRGRWLGGASSVPVARAWPALLRTCLTLTLGTIALGVLALGADPSSATIPRAVGALAGFASGAATLLVYFGWVRLHDRMPSTDQLAGGFAALTGFVACQMTGRFDPWSGYHFVMVVPVLAALGALGLAGVSWASRDLRWGSAPWDDRPAVIRWGTIALAVSLAFTLRGYRVDPESPANTVAMLGVLAVLASGLAGWSGHRAYLAVAAVLVNLGASLWWWNRPGTMVSSPTDALINLLTLNVIALTLPLPLWYAIERRFAAEGRGQRPLAPVGSIGAGLAVGLFGLAVVIGLMGSLDGLAGRPDGRLGWIAVGTLVVGIGSGAWFRLARGVAPGLYGVGLATVGWSLVGWHLTPNWLGWLGMIFLAAYAIGTSYLASKAGAFRRLGDRLRVPHRREGDQTTGPPGWLVAATGVISGVVLLLAFHSVLNNGDPLLRAASAQAALGISLAIGLLANGARRSSLQVATLGLIVVGAVAWGWAGIAPDRATVALDRAAVAVVVGLGGATALGLGLARWLGPASDWLGAARRVTPVVLGLTGLIAAGLLLAEAGDRWQGQGVAISPAGGVGVGLALLGGIVAALVAALVPGRDPLGLTERGRTAYIYGAEALLASFAAHARMTLPGWFDGWLAAVWPLGLMALAFAGVGVGAIARRLGQTVLVEPLERTGAILPAFPVVAVLLGLPVAGRGEATLVLVALLYAVLGATRRSPWWTLPALLAGNSALWLGLSGHAGVSLLIHPQLWVIPPALSVLFAAQANAGRLGPKVLASVRNTALTALYLASTADMVLVGVARAPWLPLVLGALALAGIAAGLALRVRGFLVLGSGALGLALFALLWFAAVERHQTWLWSAAGVVAGGAILLGAALLERHRAGVRRALDRFREWQP